MRRIANRHAYGGVERDWLVSGVGGAKARKWRLVRTVAGKRACVQLARTLVLARVRLITCFGGVRG